MPKAKTPKKRKPKEEDESAFPGKTFDELVGALLKVPHTPLKKKRAKSNE